MRFSCYNLYYFFNENTPISVANHISIMLIVGVCIRMDREECKYDLGIDKSEWTLKYRWIR